MKITLFLFKKGQVFQQTGPSNAHWFCLATNLTIFLTKKHMTFINFSNFSSNLHQFDYDLNCTPQIKT